MPEKLLRLDIITPDRTVVSEDVNWVLAPGETGEFQVYSGHTPFLTALKIGQVTYEKEGLRVYLGVSGGFCEVMPDHVLILARTAERSESIDRARAEAARSRAADRLAGKDSSHIDETRARQALLRALNRLQVSEMR